MTVKMRRAAQRSACLIAALLLPRWAAAQVEEPQPPRVAITIEGDKQAGIRPALQGLPAVSRDGTRVAFVVARDNYDDSGWIELRIVSPGRVQTRLLLEEHRRRHAESVQSAAQAKAIRNRVQRAQNLLDAGGFVPLVESTKPDGASWQPNVGASEWQPVKLGRWQLTYRRASRTLGVLDAQGTVVYSRRVGMTKHTWCCSPDPDPPAHCTVSYSNVQVWGSDQVVFVKGMHWGGPDGCEVDDHYLVIWPAIGKSHLATNE